MNGAKRMESREGIAFSSEITANASVHLLAD